MLCPVFSLKFMTIFLREFDKEKRVIKKSFSTCAQNFYSLGKRYSGYLGNFVVSLIRVVYSQQSNSPKNGYRHSYPR